MQGFRIGLSLSFLFGASLAGISCSKQSQFKDVTNHQNNSDAQKKDYGIMQFQLSKEFFENATQVLFVEVTDASGAVKKEKLSASSTQAKFGGLVPGKAHAQLVLKDGDKVLKEGSGEAFLTANTSVSLHITLRKADGDSGDLIIIIDDKDFPRRCPISAPEIPGAVSSSDAVSESSKDVVGIPKPIDCDVKPPMPPLPKVGSLLNLADPTLNQKIELAVKDVPSSTVVAEFGSSAESDLKISLSECDKISSRGCSLSFSIVKDKAEKAKITKILNQISAVQGPQPEMACMAVVGPEYFVTLIGSLDGSIPSAKKQEWRASPNCPIGGFKADSFEKVRGALVEYIKTHVSNQQ